MRDDLVEPLPIDMAQFLYDYVESIEQLEILRVLSEDRSKEWDAPELAGEVQATPGAVRGHVAALSARGLLLAKTSEGAVSCRYGVANSELEGLVGRLLQTYKERPVTMIRMIYERARDPLRAFSEAFRIRRED